MLFYCSAATSTSKWLFNSILGTLGPIHRAVIRIALKTIVVHVVPIARIHVRDRIHLVEVVCRQLIR